MAQSTKDIPQEDSNTKFSYQQFCKMLQRFYKEQEQKDKHKRHGHIGYKPMSEFKRLKKNIEKGK